MESIHGIATTEIASKYGTPCYVYAEEKILNRISELREFDTIRFAQKACSTLAILQIMRANGVVVDAVSAGEIRRALAAGYSPHCAPGEAIPPIVFTADLFDEESLDLVVEHGIHVNAGSIDMIHQLGLRAPGREITIRINPGFGHGHSQKTNTGGDASKHGIWHEQLDECLLTAENNGLLVSGIHMHIGSGSDLEHLSQVCQAVERAAGEVGRMLRSISVGGGLPVPYRDSEPRVDIRSYFDCCDDARKRIEAIVGHEVSLEIEPGRYLTAESGYLISEIRAIKRTGNHTFYLVDAGFNNLARPVLYGSYHPIDICFPKGRQSLRNEQVVVGGPLCESGDIFTQVEGGFVSPRELPAATVGDLVVIGVCGAYGSVMGSNYNSKPLCAEALIRGGGLELIRSRQSFEQMTECEILLKGVEGDG